MNWSQQQREKKEQQTKSHCSVKRTKNFFIPFSNFFPITWKLIPKHSSMRYEIHTETNKLQNPSNVKAKAKKPEMKNKQ